MMTESNSGMEDKKEMIIVVVLILGLFIGGVMSGYMLATARIVEDCNEFIKENYCNNPAFQYNATEILNQRYNFGNRMEWG